MEKGVTKHWTPKQEELWGRFLAGCHTFAQRALVMTFRDLIKYDGRTREGKRAWDKARLRLAVATDEDIAEMVALESRLGGNYDDETAMERIKELQELRAKVLQQGIPKEKLGCQ